MPKRDRLQDRAEAWVRGNLDRELPASTARNAFIAGWHARGRADRVTKAKSGPRTALMAPKMIHPKYPKVTR